MGAEREILNQFLPSRFPMSSKAWTAGIIDQTIGLPRAQGACELAIEFVLPHDRGMLDSPSDLRLDSILRRLLEALEGTVFRGEGVMGDRGEVVSIQARSRVARVEEESGIRVILRRIDGGP
jgi:hypothetical protein